MAYNKVTAGRKASAWMRSRITSILKGLKDGKKWIGYTSGSKLQAPVNALTGRPFSGWNFIAMLFSGYNSPGWLTINQVNQLGAKVIKGEHGVPTFFAKSETIIDKDTGDPRQTFAYKGFTHFNVEQCIGLPQHVLDAFMVKSEPVSTNPQQIPEIQSFIDKLNPTVKQTDMTRIAAYSPSRDIIKMPLMSMFVNEENYYSVLLHELGHWTGHKDRLARKSIVESSPMNTQGYAREELVAEFFSGALSALFGIDHAPVTDEVSITDNHDVYIGTWLERLNSDMYAQELLTATAQAYNAIVWAQEQAGMDIVPISEEKRKRIEASKAQTESVAQPVAKAKKPRAKAKAKAVEAEVAA